MPDYAKLLVQAVFSKASGYDPPFEEFNKPATLYASTPDEVDHREVECDTGAGTSIVTSTYTSVDYAIIFNRDGTNYVTVTFRSAGNSAVDNIVRVAAGKILILTDITVANNITIAANSAVVECELWIVGT